MFTDFLEIGLNISFGNQIFNISGFGALKGFNKQGRGEKYEYYSFIGYLSLLVKIYRR